VPDGGINLRVAAIDVGTNSTRLLVADVTAYSIESVLTAMETTRLGQGINKGYLAKEAMERTLAVIQNFVSKSFKAGAKKTVIAATSAVRDAANRDEFTTGVRLVAGREMRVLSGLEEAKLSYLGVTAAFGDVRDAVVVDIGGGSTEFTWRRNGKPYFISVNVGAVRMTEGKWIQSQVVNTIGNVFREVKSDCPGEVIGVGGTVTALAAMAQELICYDSKKVHGYRLTIEIIVKLLHKLNQLSLEERKKLPGLQPQRADIIPAGTMILSIILQGLSKDSLLVSEADILYGLSYEAAGRNLSQ